MSEPRKYGVQPDFFAQQTQEYWIARARYEIWELAQRAHEHEKYLNSYRRATISFINCFLPPQIKERVKPQLERLERLNVNRTVNPMADAGKYLRETLLLLDRLNEQITEEMYREGLILKPRRQRMGGEYPL